MGLLTHGMTDTPVYRVWTRMKFRCGSKSQDYANYGARGITVCQRWQQSFENFFEDMGHAPTGKSLDRIDNGGNYEPGNCRWATRREQQQNRRSVINLTHDGRTQCAAEWARELGVTNECIYQRLKLGWTVERTLTTIDGRL